MAALDAARRGQDPILLTQMLAGLNISGAPAAENYAAVGTVNSAGVYQTGAAQLRRSTTYRTNLLNGNYQAVVTSLLTDTAGTGYVSNTGLGVTSSARIVRNGCDRIASQNGSQAFGTGANAITLRCFPENYFIANPQVSVANYRTNSGRRATIRWRPRLHCVLPMVSAQHPPTRGPRTWAYPAPVTPILSIATPTTNCCIAPSATIGERTVRLNCRSGQTSCCSATVPGCWHGCSNGGRQASSST